MGQRDGTMEAGAEEILNVTDFTHYYSSEDEGRGPWVKEYMQPLNTGNNIHLTTNKEKSTSVL